MGIDNRTRSFGDWPTTQQDPAANTYNCPLYTDINDWQDTGTRGYNLDQCSQFSGWRGCLWQYGQRHTISNASSESMALINPWRQTAHPDRTLETTGRIVLVKMWTENNVDEMPNDAGGNYDPDTFSNAPVWNLMYTGDGATDTNPPVGDFWTPWVGIYFHASTDGSVFYIRNQSGAEIDIAMSMWVFQHTTHGYSEKRIWTQNPHQVILASNLNDLQDYAVQQLELDQTTLVPINTYRGAAVYYGQFTYPTGASTLLDASRDWRERILLSYWQEVGAAAQLPGGVGYDPDIGPIKNWNLWSTEGGADPANPGAGGEIAWQPAGAINQWLAAARINGAGINQGELFMRNTTGGPTWGMLFTLQSEEVA